MPLSLKRKGGKNPRLGSHRKAGGAALLHVPDSYMPRDSDKRSRMFGDAVSYAGNGMMISGMEQPSLDGAAAGFEAVDVPSDFVPVDASDPGGYGQDGATSGPQGGDHNADGLEGGGFGGSGGQRPGGGRGGGGSRRNDSEFIQGKLFLGGLNSTTSQEQLHEYCVQWCVCASPSRPLQ